MKLFYSPLSCSASGLSRSFLLQSQGFCLAGFMRKDKKSIPLRLGSEIARRMFTRFRLKVKEGEQVYSKSMRRENRVPAGEE